MLIRFYHTDYRMIETLYSRHKEKATGSSDNQQGGTDMRGYYTANGFYGLMNGKYALFASESDYYETAAEDSEDDN